jgi:HSP20 family molecular chaperone IbpA
LSSRPATTPPAFNARTFQEIAPKPRIAKSPETRSDPFFEAAMKDGVLTITLPKSAEAQKKEKTIPVQKA